jgi:hypothetical protein
VTEFEEAAKQFKRLAGTARELGRLGPQLVKDAMQLAVEEAQDTLMQNLIVAIAFGGEFQRGELEGRLLRFFEQPGTVTVDEGNGVRINVHPEEAREQWLQAQAYANWVRNAGKTLRGWALNPTPSQRRAYWRNKVYPDEEKWLETIETRLAFLNDPNAAPYWYFLEYGTGPGAFPALSPQRFVQKTVDEVGGHQVINRYLDEMLLNYQAAAARALDRAVVSTANPAVIVKQEVRWTAWYSWRGKQRRHQFIAGKGIFTGKAEVK